MIITGCKKESDAPGNQTANQVLIITEKLSVANILQSNMVVQRDKPMKIWGRATTGFKVTVNVSWNPTAFTAVTESGGNWFVNIPAAAANAVPQTITIKSDGSATIDLNNILIGDVWICSGQSNMVMPLIPAYSPFNGITNYQAEVDAANYPLIREATIYDNSKSLPISDIADAAKWQACSPLTTGNMSATAYFFARKLNTTLNVPIGIIVAATNGSSCESWIDSQTLQSNTYLANIYSVINKSSMLYNGMISPLSRLAVKGFIWYQGESNYTNDPSAYTKLNSALISGWRDAFNQGVLPFYYVQLPPFDVNGTGNAQQNNYAKFREGQANIRTTTSGTGMAITMDVGEPQNLHPANKKPVGERLALLALNKTYNQNVLSVGPQYLSFEQANGVITINFVNATAIGLNTINGQPLNQYFYVAGTDHVFRLGNAVINSNKIVITPPAGTPLPAQAVRYAFSNFPVTNLQNNANLPMEPFRSDNWDN
jgi:sialate O-acetylesterase